MKVIKVKVKHILLSLLIISGLILIGFGLGQQVLYSYAKSQANNGNKQESFHYYQKAAELFPNGSLTAEALYWSAQTWDGAYQPNFYIFPGRTSSWGAFSPDAPELEEIISIYQRIIVDYPDTIWAKHSKNRLSDLYFQSGQWEQVIEISKTIPVEDQNSSDINEKLFIIYRAMGQDEQALYALAKTIDRGAYYQGIYTEASADILLKQGNFREAKERYEQVLGLSGQERDYRTGNDDVSFESPTVVPTEVNQVKTKLAALDEFLQAEPDKQKLGAIAGQVLALNRPLAGVRVYLEFAEQSSWSTPPRIHTPVVITDNEGKFTFNGILPGNYVLGLGVTLEQIEGLVPRITHQDKVTVTSGTVTPNNIFLVAPFNVIAPVNGTVLSIDDKPTISWDPVPEAATYELHMAVKDSGGSDGGTYGFPIASEIVGNHYLLDFQKDGQFMGASFSTAGITPASILGFFYPGGEYLWSVKAFDAEGNFITSTDAFYLWENRSKKPHYFIDAKDQLIADKYLINRKYGQAIAAYEELLAEDPDNINALSALARIYFYGTSIDGKNQNLLAAESLAKRLVELNPNYYNLSLLAEIEARP